MADLAVPNLPSRDFDRTAGFYGGFGFTVSYRDDGWLILRRDDAASTADSHAAERGFFKLSLTYLFGHFLALLVQHMIGGGW